MISNELLKKKILDQAFSGNLIKSSFDNVCYKEISLVMKNYDSIRKPVSKTIRNNLNNRYNYYGATGKIDMIDDYIFDGNYLLIGEDGGNFYVDKDNCYVVNGKFWANNHVHVLSANNAVTNNYIKHYLNSLDFVKMGLITGTAIPKLNQKNLNSIKVPMISLNNQAKIVEKIEKCLKLIDKKEKNDKEKEKLKTLLKEKILDSAIHGELVENDLSLPVIDVEEIKEVVPFEIPNNWKWTYIKHIGDVIGGGTPDTKNPEYWNGNINWITPADMKSNDKYIRNGKKNITEKGLIESSARIMPKGAIVISSRAPIGYVKISSEPVTTSQGCKSIVVNDKKEIFNEYIYYYIKSITDYLNSIGTGTTFKEISGKTLSKVLVPIPPLEQQKKIVEKIEKCFELIEQL